LLLTDGTVMVQETSRPHWYRLTPINGSYVSGVWSQLQSSYGILYNNGDFTGITPYTGAYPEDFGPDFYASAVLADGRVIVCGGENSFDRDGTFNGNRTNTCAVFDPTQNEGQGQWTKLPFPATVLANEYVGDAPCAVLANGWFFLGSCGWGGPGLGTALLDPKAANASQGVLGTWYAGPPATVAQNELTWTLLGNGAVLSPCNGNGTNPRTGQHGNSPSTYRYVPPLTMAPPEQVGSWVVDASYSTEYPIATNTDTEMGPAVGVPGGWVLVTGPQGNYGFYVPGPNDETPGRWTLPGKLPQWDGQQLACTDAPATLLPNGNVLLMAGPNVPTPSGTWSGPPVIPVLYVPGQPPSL
jgi:hypothetical protein